jgi:hypothetical protein
MRNFEGQVGPKAKGKRQQAKGQRTRSKGVKKWFILGGILIVFLIGGYFILSFYAVKLVQAHLQKAMGKVMGSGLTGNEVRVNPTYLSVQNIEYEDPQSKQKLLKIEEVRVYPSVFSFLKGTPGIDKFCLIKPTFLFSRSREGAWSGPVLPVGKEARPVPGETKERKRDTFQIEIRKIQIQDGSLDLEDHRPGGPPVQIQMSRLDFEIEDIRYPMVSRPSPFELKGTIKGTSKDGKLGVKGWINLQTLDQETSLKIEGVEIKTLEPYYRKRVSAEIESGLVGLESKISIKERIIDAPGYVELVDLRLKEEGTFFWIPAKTLISLLKDKGNRIRARFHVRGNLDDPKFNLQESALNHIAFSMAEALGLPVKSVGELIFGGTEKGTEGLADGVKSLGELFKKKEKKR